VNDRRKREKASCRKKDYRGDLSFKKGDVFLRPLLRKEGSMIEGKKDQAAKPSTKKEEKMSLTKGGVLSRYPQK